MRADAFVSKNDIQAKTRRWLRRIYSGLHPRDHLVLVPEKCTLLIIDMVGYFASPEGRACLPSAEAIIPGIRTLLDLWRKRNGQVVFTRHCHREGEPLGMLGRFFSDHIRCGESQSRIISRLRPLPEEKVIRKNTYDAFFGTDLEEFLEEHCQSQLLISGVLTQLCCETTARSGFVRGFEIFAAADALTTSTEDLHLASLMSLASGFALVTDVKSICR